jgi:hypothetical protein
MNAPQWKPGDVGVAATNERFIVDSDGRCFWPGDEDARTVGVSGKPAPNDRPLVVIDPEDGMAVAHLLDEARRHLAADERGSGTDIIARICANTDALQAALRSLIAPPPKCAGALNIAGAHFACDQAPDHPGAHSNREAKAIWGSLT